MMVTVKEQSESKGGIELTKLYKSPIQSCGDYVRKFVY